MRTFASFILFLIFSYHSNAQESTFDKVYFNHLWRITTEGNGLFYRTSEFDSSLPAYKGIVEDYYADTQNIEMTGFYAEGKKDGKFTFYFPGGTLRLEAFYSKGKRIGNWIEYHKNGSVKTQVSYENNTEKVLIYVDSQGNSLINKNKVSYKVPYDTEGRDSLVVTGIIKNGLRHGNWKVELLETEYSSIKYKDGKLLGGKIFEYDHTAEITHPWIFPIINEPIKFISTEAFKFDYGLKIRNNYVLEGLNEHKFLSREKVVILTHSELENYIQKEWGLHSKSDSLIIKLLINVENGVPKTWTIEPDISKGAASDLSLILKTIESIGFIKSGEVEVNYNMHPRK